MEKAMSYYERLINEAEGWGVFYSNGKHEIQRVDEAEIFESDEAARDYVIRRASTGSRRHRKALYIIEERE